MAIKHAFTSSKADGADTTLVRPANWNADHVGRGSMANMPDGTSGLVLTAQGVGVDPAYALLVDADIPATIARDAEADSMITTHKGDASAHHTRTTNASELTSEELPTARLAANIKNNSLTFIIDGGGSAITTEIYWLSMSTALPL